MVLISKYIQRKIKCNIVDVNAIEIIGIFNCLHWMACHFKINTTVRAKMSHVKTMKQDLDATTVLTPASVYL
jgi:hypothetical protein